MNSLAIQVLQQPEHESLLKPRRVYHAATPLDSRGLLHRYHQPCAKAIRDLEAPLVTCEAVIAEACYLVRNLPGASEAVIENVTEGIFQIPFQLSTETGGLRQTLRKYR